jgi:hypothetical protein
MADEATALNSHLARDLEDFVVKSGVDRTLIDREAAALLERWGY